MRRAIRVGGLPSLRVQDEPRVGRVDLLEWAMQRGLRVAPELFARADAGHSALGPALGRGGWRDVGDAPWAEAIAPLELARPARCFAVDPRGVAMPRPRAPVVGTQDEPVLHVLRRSAPARLPGAGEGPEAWVLFLLLTPTIRAHLAALTRLAWHLAGEELVDALRGPSAAGALQEAFARGEEEGAP